MPSLSCTVEQGIEEGIRLDRYAAEHLRILSRSQVKTRNLEARLNGKQVKISRLLKSGDKLDLSWQEAESSFLVPEDIPLEIIYEDDRVIVLNKAQGMVVHPGAGNHQGTLANALLYRMTEKKNSNSTFPIPPSSLLTPQFLRPGIVHRLDKDTSGVIIAAFDDEAHAFLSAQFKERKLIKSYAALVYGCPKESSGCIDTLIARSKRNRKTFAVSKNEGRRSITRYKLVRSYGNYSLLLIRPKTGRTHQIRVHLKHLGNPILGDPIYGSSASSDQVFGKTNIRKATLMLHAKRLSIVLPGLLDPHTFRTPLPPRFKMFTNPGWRAE